ncbi:Keratinocyte differentiation factor 1 [Oryzias melastigma]|uniref:Keratinocyte differentiation factor 1 n=1 Tax=Oryzias melastigma TaxID=30732 RepID=A0A3B3C9M3_ORYME|nr:keratinocyte differentiation factor 1 [Oryzias melastigma]XP_024118264.1 keratinocyte differentiation factor 1 [Oryzias melastigma]XP_036070226.1 keratinocyte differentiation factor 1 [Oryzias melastigma]XP_036070227.1 keratinocyte differentiation factor 1 [Oryzias melastigma]XP_036070228.1 keratinocyte differentiation factor 1 [Oryzias melastigma]KAF6717214.1 Keratinocyte differentiation factor 1 [Oryzias melastigma]
MSAGSQESSYEERCVDPEEEQLPPQEPKVVRKAHLKDAKESETIGFIPGSAEPSSAAQTCNPCASPRSCRTFVCSVLTCGLYRLCQRSILAPCLAPNESSPEEPESVSLQARNPGKHKEEAEQNDTPQTFNDIYIGGVKVGSLKEFMDTDTISPSYIPSSVVQTQPSYQSLHDSMHFDDWEVGEEDVDSLITKKLLELYSEYQIEELARCTSDSVFLRKSKTINQLINSLAEEHKMDEQEAENRLVRGIIRISTRKSTKKRPPVSRTFSDSGNETMNGSSSFTFSNNNDYRSNPNIQISEQTSSDKFAREMWRKNGGHSSGAPSGYSHTETDSSGVPLIRSSVRT